MRSRRPLALREARTARTLLWERFPDLALASPQTCVDGQRATVSAVPSRSRLRADTRRNSERTLRLSKRVAETVTP